MVEKVIQRYADRVGYDNEDLAHFQKDGHRIRHVRRLAEAAPRYSIRAEVIASQHCNSGHVQGQTFLLDMDGNFITKHCPTKMCVYLIAQLMVPVALINERLSEGLDPSAFHFMRQVQCPDAGVECMGYGQVRIAIEIVPRRPHTGS